MKNDIEKRLHRVMIKLDNTDIKCPYAKECISVENCKRCNVFYSKCTIFSDFISASKEL